MKCLWNWTLRNLKSVIVSTSISSVTVAIHLSSFYLTKDWTFFLSEKAIAPHLSRENTTVLLCNAWGYIREEGVWTLCWRYRFQTQFMKDNLPHYVTESKDTGTAAKLKRFFQIDIVHEELLYFIFWGILSVCVNENYLFSTVVEK